MTHITETLRAIERRADLAVVQELRLMTQEILAMRTHLTLEDRTHADALLLRLDHLEYCRQIGATRHLQPPLPKRPPNRRISHSISTRWSRSNRVAIWSTSTATTSATWNGANSPSRWQLRHS